MLCSDCGRCPQEPIAFSSGPYLRYTKWLAQYVLALRKEMSIRAAVAHFTGLHWESVKQIEKVYLLKKDKKPITEECSLPWHRRGLSRAHTRLHHSGA